jgi:hypothetical protein
MAWMVLVAAAVFLFRSEKDIDMMRSGLHAFDLQARETTDALAELRAAQQAYVVGGQGVAFWVAKVATTGDTVSTNIETLQKSASAPVTRAALENAIKSLRQFTNADKRALEYINASQPLMAGDVIFTEGGQAAAGTAQHVEAARMAERQDVDAREASLRRQAAMIVVGSAVVLGLIVMLLVPAAATEPKHLDEPRTMPSHIDAQTQPYTWIEDKEGIDYARRVRLPSTPAPSAYSNGNGNGNGSSPDPVETPIAEGMRLNLGDVEPANIYVTPSPNGKSDPIRLTLDAALETTGDARPVPVAAPGFLKAAADLATDFGRVQDLGDLKQLIARAAALTEASGVVVWLGNSQGGDLRPVLTHGYSPAVVTRLAPVPRSANNAAAAAYRSGTLQVVPSQPFSSGAIVAPILGPEGCIGALSAEFRGAEASEPVQAFAAIVAAHLAGVLGASPSEANHAQAQSA